jgi:hypothetical protein
MAASSSYSLIPGRHSELGMEYDDKHTGAAKTQGKSWGIFICWLLGNGCLFGFNGMLTIEDYYTYIFPKYHPTRIITLAYQPFVLVTTAIFTYHEAKVNTRLRNLAGYMLFFLSSFGVIIVSPADYSLLAHTCSELRTHYTKRHLFFSGVAGCLIFRRWWNRPICWCMHYCRCFWHSRWSCSRWDDW